MPLLNKVSAPFDTCTLKTTMHHLEYLECAHLRGSMDHIPNINHLAMKCAQNRSFNFGVCTQLRTLEVSVTFGEVNLRNLPSSLVKLHVQDCSVHCITHLSNLRSLHIAFISQEQIDMLDARNLAHILIEYAAPSLGSSVLHVDFSKFEALTHFEHASVVGTLVKLPETLVSLTCRLLNEAETGLYVNCLRHVRLQHLKVYVVDQYAIGILHADSLVELEIDSCHSLNLERFPNLRKININRIDHLTCPLSLESLTCNCEKIYNLGDLTSLLYLNLTCSNSLLHLPQNLMDLNLCISYGKTFVSHQLRKCDITVLSSMEPDFYDSIKKQANLVLKEPYSLFGVSTGVGP